MKQSLTQKQKKEEIFLIKKGKKTPKLKKNTHTHTHTHTIFKNENR
jgi:hypothetical protein